MLIRGRRQAEEVDTKDVKIDVVEADVEIDVAKEETIGDKQMDATAIDDDAAEVVEEKEDAFEKDGEMEKEEVVENNEDNENEHSEVVEEDGEAVEVDDEEEE